MRTERRYRWICLPVLLLFLAGMLLPSAAYGAAGDSVFRFELETDSPRENLKPGDAVTVSVVMSRADGLQEPSSFYGVQLDIAYDGALFKASQLTSAGPKRPDGESWKGSWSCGSVPGTGGESQIRVLCTNLALVGGLSNADRVPGGKTVIGSFTLTVAQNAADTASQVRFIKVLNIGSDLKKTDAEEGGALTLRIAGSGHTPDQGGGSGNDSLSPDGSGGGSSGSGGSGGSGTGSGSGGSGSGDSGSGSGSNAGNGSGAGSGSGDSGSTAGGGSAGSPQDAAAKVRFEELTDVSGHWAAESIRFAVERGIAAGNEFKQFEPDKSITRAEFCQMAANAFGYTGGSSARSFLDVTENDWYSEAVMSLEAAGIVSGVGDGLFGADQTLSRQDMAVILSRILKDRKRELPVIREYKEFSDGGRIADYARQPLEELYRTGVISGTDEDRLSPEDNTTRAETAVVMMKLLKENEGR